MLPIVLRACFRASPRGGEGCGGAGPRSGGGCGGPALGGQPHRVGPLDVAGPAELLEDQITRALMSIWPRSTPWRAQVGSAWCRLCQDSPALRIASGQKLVERSRAANGREPMVWQMGV